MKKHFIYLGLIAASAFTLTNCAKEFENPSQQPESTGIPFELTASTSDTKTANDGLVTNWVADDALSVFHVETGATEFVENDKFTITSENLAANKFTGELTTAPVNGMSYDWHVFYPYNAQYGISKLAEGKIGYTNYGSSCYDGEVSSAQSQEGNNSKAHLAGEKLPLYGVVKNVASQNPVSVELSHLMSVIEVEVNNSTTEPITVSNIKFTAPGYIVGSFYYDTVNGDYEISSNDGKYNSKTAELNVKNAEAIAVGSSAKFYIGIVPISITDGEISMTVVTDKGTQTKTKTNPNITFAAGVIKNIGFTYNQAVAVKTVSLPWTEDFSSEDLTNYTIVSGGSATKLYDDNLAGGTAPEILISKGDGAMSVNIDPEGYVGNLTLTFLSNYPDRVSITSDTPNVEIFKSSNVNYIISVPNGTGVFSMKISNSTGSNARVDNISLVKGGLLPQQLSFEKPLIVLVKDSAEANAFEGQSVSGAKTSVTYTSSDKDVATVDGASGAIVLGAKIGTTTITAVASSGDGYDTAEASYEIRIIESGAGLAYTLIDDASLITEGIYLLASNNKVNVYNGTIDSGHLQTSVGTLSNDVFTAPLDAQELEFISTGVDNQFYIKVGDEYLYSKKASSKNFAFTSEMKYGKWTFSTAGGMLNAVNEVVENTGGANIRCYNETSFRSYSGTGNGTAFYLYKKN